MSKFKCLDLFCGAGGLSLGFKLAGFDIVGGVEWDKAAIETHKANFNSEFEFCGDIKDISDDEILSIGHVDVIIGGPPCQGFSSANRHEKELDDPRNKLFYEYIRFIKLLKPDCFVIENVKEILSKNNGYAKNRITEITSDLGYEVNVKVLLASEYGVPQIRRRAFFVGVKKDYNAIFDFDRLPKVKTPVTVYDAIGDICYPEKGITNWFLKYAKDSDVLTNHDPKMPNEKVIQRMSFVPQGGNWKNVPEELWDTKRDNRHSSAYRRLKFDEPSITIDTGHMNYFHPIYNRVPTVRESARLQSFPDSFVFCGNQGEQYRQVGNAVPPLLAKVIALEIKRILSGEDTTNKKNGKNIIDLFCGAGGLSLGFEMAGFNSVLAIDKWNDAIVTYNHNRNNKCGTTVDIHDFSNEQLLLYKQNNNIVGIVGGPPCQGFSLVGTRKTNDPRNSLYIEYVRFVDVIRPEFFLLENVPGLLSLENGKFKEDIIKRFSELGYNVNFKTLVASDYGVPQSRSRVIFIGLRKDVYNNAFFDFDAIEKKEMVGTEMALSDLPDLIDVEEETQYRVKPKNDYQKMMREGCTVLTNHVRTNHTAQTIDVISRVPDGGNIRDLPEEFYKVRNYNAAFKRMNSKLPSGTIDCGHRNYFHYSLNRIPTARESARIQSFPDKYEFIGSKGSQYTQIGNAVPPLMAYAIAKELSRERATGE